MESQVDYLKRNGLWLSSATQQAAWGLIDPINSLGENVRGIEIGVQSGINSYMLLEFCPNIKKIMGIDPYRSYRDWDKVVPQADLDTNFTIFQANYEHMKDRFELVKMSSNEAAPLLKNDTYDVVFIDGDHSLRAVLDDLSNYTPKIRKGGIIAGHDIGLSGVTMAVQSWCKRNRIDLSTVKLIENTAWFWINE